MKKFITTFITLTLFSIVIFGQESTETINRLIGYNHSKWDDVWKTEDSIIFSYANERGLIDNNEIVKIKWETLQYDNLLKLKTVSGNLTNRWKIDRTYDSNDNVLIKTNFNWVASSGSWEKNSKKEYTYDSNNNVLTTEHYIGDTGSWMKYNKEKNTYDSNNSILSKIFFDGSLDTWVKSDKKEYTYDIDNNNLTYVYFQWAEEWVKDTKEVYTYNSNNSKLTKKEYNWAVNFWVPDAWSLEKRTTYSYYLNNYLSTIKVYDSNPLAATPDRSSEYLYDANNNILSITDYSLENSGVWEVYFIKEYTYDSNNNRKSYTEYVWSPLIFNMAEDRKWEYTYDGNKNKLTEVYYTWGGVFWREYFKSDMEFDRNSKITSQTNFEYNNTLSSWNNYSFNKYYYEELDTNNVSIQEIRKLNTSYGPNPFTNNINFTFESETAGSVIITITDVQGRFVYKASTNAFQGENTFSWDGTSSYGNEVAKGLYHFNISIGNSIATGKIIKK